MNTAEVANLVRLKPPTIARWIKKGYLPGLKKHGRWFVSCRTVRIWIEAASTVENAKVLRARGRLMAERGRLGYSA